ncbi:hypothetical protein [Nocardia niigatensis]|uniref:hypothetical protein n=1 Tax=Nocardia niigatensis TaxID=209249 RepID=UPI000592EA6C|nr:hypothetical protein [Nocardia niigatensis]
MSIDAFMNVSSTNTYRDDEFLVHYTDSIDKVVVHLGSGELYMSLPFAEELFTKLREALKDGALAQAANSGTGLWLSATDFVSSDAVSELRGKTVA